MTVEKQPITPATGLFNGVYCMNSFGFFDDELKTGPFTMGTGSDQISEEYSILGTAKLSHRWDGIRANKQS